MGLFNSKTGLKILFIASEAAPFIKVGGLGEVMNSLPKALRELGYDARIMMPKYITINREEFPFQVEQLGLRLGSLNEDDLFVSNVLRYNDKNGKTLAYFLENMEYYEKRANVYGYSDDAIRWALFSKGVLEFLKRSDWLPDVIVASDWQTGLLPNFLHTLYKNDKRLSNIAVLFAIHNLYYQGMFDHRFVGPMDRDDGQSPIPDFNDPRLLKLNFMRRGIMYADVITTVSSTYSQEITTSEYGELLDDLLRERRTRLFGILNGVNYEFWNPKKDRQIEFRYDVKTIKERSKNKAVLRQKFNFSDENDMPILGVVSRLTEQKGFWLLADIIYPLLENYPFQLIILGSGDASFMSFFQELGAKYPSRVAAHLTYDETLPHLIYSGADIILIPSKFEPSGLTQMEAMRYGAVPLVRKTGGLADSVIDYDPKTNTGTGFVFEKFDRFAFYGTAIRALETFRYPKIWEGIQKRAMTADFSWKNSAKEYAGLFHKAVEFHQNALG